MHQVKFHIFSGNNNFSAFCSSRYPTGTNRFKRIVNIVYLQNVDKLDYKSHNPVHLGTT